MDNRLKCQSCSDVIGFYEPVVVRADAAVRVTSRTAEPGLSWTDGNLYHRGCYVGTLEAGELDRTRISESGH